MLTNILYLKRINFSVQICIYEVDAKCIGHTDRQSDSSKQLRRFKNRDPTCYFVLHESGCTQCEGSPRRGTGSGPQP